MTAMILNAGLGRRMGAITKKSPKCMTEIYPGETILSRQLKQISKFGVVKTVITTGAFDTAIKSYCNNANIPLKYTFVHNSLFVETNYIYSIYLARLFLDDDILLMHGDLVIDEKIIGLLIRSEETCMTVCSGIPLPDKDFKAIINDNRIIKVGVNFFDCAIAAQPLYKFFRKDFTIWLDRISNFCENGITDCYAENALNEVTDKIILRPLDIKNMLCSEVDTLQDLENISFILKNKKL